MRREPTDGRNKAASIGLFWVLCVFGVANAIAATPVEKRVVVDKTEQMLHCYEDGTLVFSSRVSTGRAGRSTPSGEFRAGVKLRMHYSTLYHHAPMPYSVQVSGNYFIHGFKDVPPWPASHGCIRVPLDGKNPAAWFFHWVETGTPISVRGQWQGRKRPQTEVFPPMVKARNARELEKPTLVNRIFGSR